METQSIYNPYFSIDGQESVSLAEIQQDNEDFSDFETELKDMAIGDTIYIGISEIKRTA